MFLPVVLPSSDGQITFYKKERVVFPSLIHCYADHCTQYQTTV